MIESQDYDFIYYDEPSPWDEGESRTFKLWENLGYLEADRFLQLAGPDKADAAGWMIVEDGRAFYNAIVQGRSKEGWLTRNMERQAIGKSFIKAHEHRFKRAVLEQIRDNQINNFLHELGLSIKELSPYKTP